MAQDNDEKVNDLVEMLRDNKIHNSELEATLKSDGIESIDDLKTNIKEDEDIEQILKTVRKRTEKILSKFSAKIVQMTGLDYEYKAPRRKAKDSNNNNNNNSGNNSGYASNDPYLSPAESPRGRKKNKRRSSNTSIGSDNSNGSYKSPRGQPSKTGKEIKVESNAQNASLMRQWLQRRGIFHKDLFSYLASHGYNSPDDLVELSESKFDYIVREVRVETFKEVNQASKRNRVDKLLTKFEKEWRKYSGIRKTNMTKEQQELWGYSPVSSARSNNESGDDNGFFDE